MCTVILPSGVNAIAVKNISYHIISSDSKAGSMPHNVLCYVNVQLKPFSLHEFIYSLWRVLCHNGRLTTTEHDVLKPIHTQI
jgi:hypothetical protein